MKQTALLEITVTGIEHGEWQGTVTQPESGRQLPFRSILELVKAAEEMMPQPEPGQP